MSSFKMDILLLKYVQIWMMLKCKWKYAIVRIVKVWEFDQFFSLFQLTPSTPNCPQNCNEVGSCWIASVTSEFILKFSEQTILGF